MLVPAVFFWQIALAVHVVFVVTAFGIVVSYPLIAIAAERLDPRSAPMMLRLRQLIGRSLVNPGQCLPRSRLLPPLFPQTGLSRRGRAVHSPAAVTEVLYGVKSGVGDGECVSDGDRFASPAGEGGGERAGSGSAGRGLRRVSAVLPGPRALSPSCSRSREHAAAMPQLAGLRREL